MSPIRVLIIDDSALVRKMLTEILGSDPGIEVLGTAPDPYIARQKIKQHNPDVVTLDVEMPRMDGLTFLRNLMRLRPMPVVMVSSLTEKGAEITLNALELGAVEVVTKPKVDVKEGLKDYSDELITKVKIAARAKVRLLTNSKQSGNILNDPSHSVTRLSSTGSHFRTTDQIIAIGASTGGTEAIKEVLTRMPPDAPGIVITQHIPEAFSASFAKRMDTISAMTVSEASNGLQILPGHVYIAPGHSHLSVDRDGARYVCRLDTGSPVNRHRPSVDVLFRSVAERVGPNAIGAVLTGMGADGARGLLEMKQAGASTVVQDEATSVVWGMPGEAAKLGAADFVMPLNSIAAKILDLAGGSGRLKKQVVGADK
ncbi:MAG: chemotaxis response regulator protein-glutamate methylesterase [Gammaproteobacteria bacterium]|nr:chemotaxis response regulator protein-glutamate methylesterase [Gammaproteobacteria bacterium]